MRQTNQSPTPKRSKSNPNFLDYCERVCQISDRYLRWPLQLIAITGFFIYLDAATAKMASCCVLALGSSNTIKLLIDKIGGSS